MPTGKIVINNMAEAFSFGVIGFGIVFAVLLLVIFSIIVILRLEKTLFKTVITRQAVKTEPVMLDPLILAIIAATAVTQYKKFRIRRIRRIGPTVKSGSNWSGLGRSAHHSSHVIK